jgi:DNA-binding protein
LTFTHKYGSYNEIKKLMKITPKNISIIIPWKYLQNKGGLIMPENLERSDENVVYVGKKPTMNYVLAVVTQFNNGAKNVVIKARGKSINKAVDIAEIVRNRFLNDLKYEVTLGTEKIKSEDRESNVSSIEILLKR